MKLIPELAEQTERAIFSKMGGIIYSNFGRIEIRDRESVLGKYFMEGG